MCPGQRHLPLLFDNAVFTRNEYGATTTISFKLYVKKQVDKLTISVSFWKCENYDHADSCEYFLKDYTSTEICEIMGKKNQVWTVFMEHFTMPNECPIKVGNYSLNQMPIYEKTLTLLPIPNAFWKIKLKGYDGTTKLYLSCVDVEFEVHSRARS
ncbi:hypothetical protein FQR65_LT07008 [Abscondita terminalis]|nr:hypothetical protein FQR65_LT07008 [Abscondita terminalis]